MKYRDVLLRLIRSLNVAAPVVAEIGVHRGRTSELLLEAIGGLTLHMVDHWSPYEEATAEQQTAFMAETFQRTQKYAGRRHIYVARAENAVEFVPMLDLAFIDASHLYEEVLRDCRTWWTKIKPGGILCGHDYGKGLGVDRAVDQWCEEIGQPPALHETDRGYIWSVVN